MSSPSRRTAHSVALTRLAQISALALAATLVGCQSTRQLDESDSVRAHNYQARIKHKPAPLVVKPKEAPPQDVWERMRQGFALQDGMDVNPRIEQQRLWFASNPSFLENAGERGSLYLHYIVERLEERDMPLELALLPAIESAYNPMAYSRAHAAGIAVAELLQFEVVVGQPMAHRVARDVVDDAVAAGVLAGEDRGAIRRAQRRGVERPSAERAFVRDPIDVRRFHVRMTARAEFVEAQVVDQNHQQIRLHGCSLSP